MKIGYDAKRAFTNTSGLGNYSRFIISGMMAHYSQNEYALFTPRRNDLFKDFYPPLAKTQVVLPNGLGKRFSSIWRTFGLRGAMPRHGIQVYHGLSNELPYGLDRHKTKLVVTIHDLIFLRFPELYPTLDRYIYRRKFKAACESAHQIIAISEQTAQDLEEFFGVGREKVQVIYQDCDPVFQQISGKEALNAVKEKYGLPAEFILCVGTLERRKNQVHLLKGWHAAGAPIPLVFIGRKTDYHKEMLAYIREHSLEKKVVFLPYIPFQELPLIYQMATLFVYPSIFEGFGIPIVEALNSGVPVITSTGSCFSEAGGAGTRYVSPSDTEELAQAIQEVLSSPDLQKQMIKQGLEHAQIFRPQVTLPQLHQVYEQVLAQ
ncbi:glycosyltransferase family 4 protein [Rufibacter latericius]|uniref:Glycosyltransferase family 1 protein n=1 Tax=Rufibacter latericius TaxID=2487040 RepID=A0A3M9MMM9_9BACT|nr:glycosyltransferase family 1 protein [Rufibacter latericius]RNI25928.1 glycosyltransferase family 1 protein [Rufibacter latericius]